jgi:hypothetical protein
MMNIAIHDALNAIVPVYKQYVYKEQDRSADPFAAAASAAHTVLNASWPDSADMINVKLKESLSNIPEGRAKKHGIALGIAAGKAILALRSGDGAYQNPLSEWRSTGKPGVYVTTPPYNVVYVPFWGKMETFALRGHAQFRSDPPPALTSDTYTRDFNEVKRFGRKNSTVRTDDQTALGYFWFEFGDINWNRIARMEAKNHHTGLYLTARMFALLNMAMADSYIACWDSKYYYKTWRPYTAIHEADRDGNDQTQPGENWQPLMQTPPVPDYPSGHAVIGNAAATVLTYFFGHNNSFTATTNTAFPVGSTRTFRSFMQAANENAESRVMVGIHFRYACDAGQQMGNKVGKWTLDNYLKPLL